MNHFQKQGKIHPNQKKQQNPLKIAEMMKKEDFLASFILGGTLSNVFNFLNLNLIFCGVFERTEIWYMKIWNNIYEHDTAIKNGLVYQWSLRMKIYMIYL